VVVVLSIVVPSVPAGLMVAIGVDSAGVVTVVVVVLSVVAGVLFTMVVLFSAGEAAGATFSVFCSHATRSAAPARMQIYFFIGNG
jgi:hypothetical protein